MILYGRWKGVIVRANDAYSGETYYCEHCGAKMYVKTSPLGNKFYALYPNEVHTKAPCIHMMHARQTHSRVDFDFGAFMKHALAPVQRTPARDPKLPEMDSVPAQNPFADELSDRQSASEFGGFIEETGGFADEGGVMYPTGDFTEEAAGFIGAAGSSSDAAGAFTGGASPASENGSKVLPAGNSTTDAQPANGAEDDPLPEKPFLKLICSPYERQ